MQVLRDKEREVQALCDAIGRNKRGGKITQHTLSSRPKRVGSTTHPTEGVPSFISALLSTLDPAGAVRLEHPQHVQLTIFLSLAADALTFIHHDGWLARRKRPRVESPVPENDDERA